MFSVHLRSYFKKYCTDVPYMTLIESGIGLHRAWGLHLHRRLHHCGFSFAFHSLLHRGQPLPYHLTSWRDLCQEVTSPGQAACAQVASVYLGTQSEGTEMFLWDVTVPTQDNLIVFFHTEVTNQGHKSRINFLVLLIQSLVLIKSYIIQCFRFDNFVAELVHHGHDLLKREN